MFNWLVKEALILSVDGNTRAGIGNGSAPVPKRERRLVLSAEPDRGAGDAYYFELIAIFKSSSEAKPENFLIIF